MNRHLHRWLARSMLLACIGTSFVPTAAFASDWIDSDPFTLTYQQISSTEGVIHVHLEPGTTKVLLPDGTSVYKDTSFTVRDNGEYDFVGYNDKGQPQQRSYTVTGLDMDDAPLFTAHGLYAKLDVEAFDTLSGVDSYRYRINGGSWSNWNPWTSTNRQEIQIPTTIRTDSFYEKQPVEVEVKDVAGNVRKIQSYIRVDHEYPVITPYTQTIYTKTRTITLPFEVTSYFKEPDTLIVKEGNQTTTYDLTKLQHTTTLLGRRPAIYRSNWEDQIQYTVQPTQGGRELELEAVKTYKDFKGNVAKLSSAKDTRYVVNVVYDTEAPTGTIHIQSDNNEVLSKEVLVDLNYTDKTSGVKSVRVYDDTHERYLTDDQIAQGHCTIPWTLSKGKDAVIYMEVEDNAGNRATFVSNPVTVSNINIDDVKVTKVVNPAFYRNGNVNGFQPPYYMIAGGSFSFRVDYSLGEVDYNRFNVTGTYRVQIVDGNNPSNILYDSRKENGGQDIPFTDVVTDGYGFYATFPLPRYYKDAAGNEKTFKAGDMVLLSIQLKRTEIVTGKVLTTDTLPNGSNIMSIGLLNPGGGSFIDSYVHFKELN
jgi:hypothetical protein